MTIAKDDAPSDSGAAASGSMLAYSHPKHKHRVMAFLVKTVKRCTTRKNSLLEQAIQHFASKGLTVKEADLQKCIDDLVNKDFVAVEGDNVSYVP